MTLQVLMPMGGLGSRFVAEGYETPKPLIEIDGVAMFQRALASFASEEVIPLFVVRRDHVTAYGLDDQIRALLPSAKVTILEHDTRGAVETCLKAAELIDPDLPISVADCDVYFESPQYFARIGQTDRPDGMLLTFGSDDARYSYAEVDADGAVVRTAEKVVISNHAILGGYFFGSGAEFLRLANEFVSAPLPEGLKEYYLSHLFNLMLDEGKRVETAAIARKFIFGTPEELKAYLGLPRAGRLA